MKTIKFKILGMTCVSCVGGVEGTLNSTKGVKKAEVTLATETAIVEYDENIVSKEKIFKLITDMTYTPIDSSVSEIDIKVIGMASPHCAGVVKSALMSLDGVEEAITDFAISVAKIKYNPDVVKTLDLKKAIDDAGYEAIITGKGENADELEDKAKKKK